MKRIAWTAVIVGGLTPVLTAAEPAGSTAAPATAPGAIEFKFKYVPGRVARQRIVTTSVGGMKLPGPLPEQKFSQVFEEILTTTCRKVNADKSAVMDVVIGDVAMKMSIGGMSFNLDTRSLEADASSELMGMDKFFKAMKGAAFAVTLTDTGKPLEVTGLGETMTKALEQLEGADLKPVKQALEQLGGFLSDDAMKEQMSSFYRITPPREGPVKIGDKWQQTWTMNIPMLGCAFEGKGDYTLVAIEDYRGRKCARIRSKETFNSKPLAKPDRPAAATDLGKVLDSLNMELTSSDGNGVYYLDYEYGELVHMRQTQSMTISISFVNPVDEAETDQDADARPQPAEPAAPIKFNLVQKIRNSTTVELLEENSEPAPSGAPAKQAAPAGPAPRPSRP